jgi:hypothetical protein
VAATGPRCQRPQGTPSSEELTVKAEVGNWVVVHGRNLDDPVREGLVVEVPHPDGSPPYLVRWLDDDRVSLVFPGPDASLLPRARHQQGGEAGAPAR